MVYTLCGKEQVIAKKRYDKAYSEYEKLDAKEKKIWDAYNRANLEIKTEEEKASKTAWSNYKESIANKQNKQKTLGKIINITFS